MEAREVRNPGERRNAETRRCRGAEVVELFWGEAGDSAVLVAEDEPYQASYLRLGPGQGKMSSANMGRFYGLPPCACVPPAPPNLRGLGIGGAPARRGGRRGRDCHKEPQKDNRAEARNGSHKSVTFAPRFKPRSGCTPSVTRALGPALRATDAIVRDVAGDLAIIDRDRAEVEESSPGSSAWQTARTWETAAGDVPRDTRC